MPGIYSTRATNYNQSSCGSGLMPTTGGKTGLVTNSGTSKTITVCNVIANSSNNNTVSPISK